MLLYRRAEPQLTEYTFILRSANQSMTCAGRAWLAVGSQLGQRARASSKKAVSSKALRACTLCPSAATNQYLHASIVLLKLATLVAHLPVGQLGRPQAPSGPTASKTCPVHNR
eukprot:scaffold22164_cov22-Tisochrysis_lutea.AAC.2